MRFRSLLRLLFGVFLAFLVAVPVAAAAKPMEPPPPPCDSFQVIVVSNDTLNGVLGFRVVGTNLGKWIPPDTGGTVGIQANDSLMTDTYGPFGAGRNGFTTITLYIDYEPDVDSSVDISIQLAVNGVDVCDDVRTPSV
jgi:hypothetical protein